MRALWGEGVIHRYKSLPYSLVIWNRLNWNFSNYDGRKNKHKSFCVVELIRKMNAISLCFVIMFSLFLLSGSQLPKRIPFCSSSASACAHTKKHIAYEKVEGWSTGKCFVKFFSCTLDAVWFHFLAFLLNIRVEWECRKTQIIILILLVIHINKLMMIGRKYLFFFFDHQNNDRSWLISPICYDQLFPLFAIKLYCQIIDKNFKCKKIIMVITIFRLFDE